MSSAEYEVDQPEVVGCGQKRVESPLYKSATSAASATVVLCHGDRPYFESTTTSSRVLQTAILVAPYVALVEYWSSQLTRDFGRRKTCLRFPCFRRMLSI